MDVIQGQHEVNPQTQTDTATQSHAIVLIAMGMCQVWGEPPEWRCPFRFRFDDFNSGALL